MKLIVPFFILFFLLPFTHVANADEQALPKPNVLDEEMIYATKPLSTYQTLIIKDFSTADTEISNVNMDDKEEREKFEAFKTRLVSILSDTIANNLKEKNVFKDIQRNGSSKENTLVLEGKFLHIDAGHAALRFFIGGLGSSRIRIKGKLVDAATGKELAVFNHVRSSPLAWKGGESVLTDNAEENASDVAEFIEKLAKGTPAPHE